MKLYDVSRADSRFAPSQWETSLQSNAVSHWLGANLESALCESTDVPWIDFCELFWNPVIGVDLAPKALKPSGTISV